MSAGKPGSFGPFLRNSPVWVFHTNASCGNSRARASGDPNNHSEILSAAASPVLVPQSTCIRARSSNPTRSNAPSVQASAMSFGSYSDGTSMARRTAGPMPAPKTSSASTARAARFRNATASPSPIRKLSARISPSNRSSLSRSAVITKSASTVCTNAASSRPSSGRKPGAIPASSGNPASNVWQKAWIVMIRSPPPRDSSTVANSVRALATSSGPNSSSSAFSSAASSVSLICTQCASRSCTRSAISAAPALVKVRHRIVSGFTPRSSSRSTRADRT